MRQFDNNINHILTKEDSAKLDNTDFIVDDTPFTTMDSDEIKFQEVLANESKDIFEMLEADDDKYNESLSEELKTEFDNRRCAPTCQSYIQEKKTGWKNVSGKIT